MYITIKYVNEPKKGTVQEEKGVTPSSHLHEFKSNNTDAILKLGVGDLKTYLKVALQFQKNTV